MEIPRVRYAISSDGTEIAYWSLGDGPPVIVLGPDLATSQIAALSQLGPVGEFCEFVSRTHRLIWMDARGVGLSTRNLPADALSPELYADDVLAVLDDNGLESATLAGSFTAARVVLEVAARFPERVDRLILQWPNISSNLLNMSGDYLSALVALMRLDWEHFADLWATFAIGLQDPALTKAAAQVLRSASSKEEYALTYSVVVGWDASPRLAQVQCPTLIIQPEGPMFELRHARQIAAAIPGAELTLVPASSLLVYDREVAERYVQFWPERDAEIGEGFRTILFTDVVASTMLLEDLGDRGMRELMQGHDEIMNAAVMEHGGRVIKTIGDGFMADFAAPSAAVQAAIEAQRGISTRFGEGEKRIQIRVGINAGEPIHEDGDLHGTAVVIAKRLESEAAPGGILVSDVVRQALAGHDFEFEDRGMMTLKGFSEPLRAWSLLWDR